MLINYVPGEECRVAVVSDGRLEELHAERLNAVSHVGNIYVGRVVNVEPAIQAAFVDFGLEHNGFLHISDLHPRYFPGGDADRTEQVGKKTPRRNRPPIQDALRRGQEIIVQVLKEGIGTKGPTLTSYLSIPGRFLVMMPDMDRVGVSRKVEDDELRRKMREILDQLELPDGFGFILRTAGMDRNKTELKRDLAYLQRLWKDMERRRATGDKPRLLYAESDLLVRALRDVLTADIHEVVIDDVGALHRAARFMKIVAPRTSTRLLHYDAHTPIFHAYGVEEQIRLIHAREVPLPSGGSLVIDETEALVAIDVNSGKMRQHGDAETTAYKTNCEAVDEICRQLRLRDLGGLVINDLIDMRSRSHQRDIEQRFRNNLKADRARSKILPISQFGIIEMTRQRMRGSVRSVHFAPCPDCSGRGLVQRPDSVAGDALRDLASVLQHERVHRVEMVVSPRVASELLSSKRQRLGRLERSAGKHVDVRVSETIPVDRVVFYAYDDRGADIDVDKLPRQRPPQSLPEWRDSAETADNWAVDPLDETAAAAAAAEPEPEAPVPPEELELLDAGDEGWVEEPSGAPAHADEAGRKKRRRRRRRGRGEGEPSEPSAAPAARPTAPVQAAESAEPGADGKRRKRRRRRRGKGGDALEPGREQAPAPAHATPQPNVRADESRGESAEPGKRRRRRRRGRGGGGGGVGGGDNGGGAQQNGSPAPRQTHAPIRDGHGFSPRGDSWDIAPQELPRAAASPDRDEHDDDSDHDHAPDVRIAEPKPAQGASSRDDSWDIAPHEIAPTRAVQVTAPESDDDPDGEVNQQAPADEPAKPARKKPRSRRSRKTAAKGSPPPATSSGGQSKAAKPAADSGPDAAPAPEGKSRRKTRRRTKKK